jgi:hypothetical protein
MDCAKVSKLLIIKHFDGRTEEKKLGRRLPSSRRTPVRDGTRRLRYYRVAKK